MEDSFSNKPKFISAVRTAIRIIMVALALMGGFIAVFVFKPIHSKNSGINTSPISDSWKAPDVKTIPNNEKGKLINHGRELIIRTAHYLGLNGTVLKMSNGMNCQNYHLEAGTKHFGNNFSAVASAYPKYRPRYGSIESIEKRIWDVAAYASSMARPEMNLVDWPDISKKPTDHPFGPFTEYYVACATKNRCMRMHAFGIGIGISNPRSSIDNFSTEQHKNAPFKSIFEIQKKNESRT